MTNFKSALFLAAISSTLLPLAMANAASGKVVRLSCELTKMSGRERIVKGFDVPMGETDNNMHGTFEGVGFDIQTFVKRVGEPSARFLSKEYYVTLSDSSGISAYSKNGVLLNSLSEVESWPLFSNSEASISLAYRAGATVKLACDPVAEF